MCYNIYASYTLLYLGMGVMRFARTRVADTTPRIPSAMRLLFRHTPSLSLVYSPQNILSSVLSSRVIIAIKAIVSYNRIKYAIIAMIIAVKGGLL